MNRFGSDGITRRATLGLAAGAMVAAASPGAAQRPQPQNWSSLDALVATAIERRLTPGMQLSVMKRGGLIYSKGFGSANLETGTLLMPTSVMRIGSVTKQFTAAAMLLLQEEGRLSIDDRLSRFVPEIAVANQVTLRQMLTHVSGLAIGQSRSQAEGRGTAMMDYDAASMIAAIQARGPELRTPPGTRWEYNNLAYRLLGAVAERVSGQRLRELFKARLIDPAGLPRTAVDDIGEVIAGRASGYELAPAAASRFRNAHPIGLSWPGGGGSMVSTTDDLCRWHHQLLGGHVLRPESLADMLNPVRLADGSLPVRPPGTDPSGSPAPLTYGLGIRTETQAGRRLVTHTGAINGFLSELTSFPDDHITVAVMINSGRAETGPNPNQEALQAALREAARIALS